MPASISQSKAVRLHSKQITVASAQGYAICGAIVKIRQLSFIEASRRTPYSKRSACAALVRQLLVYRGVATHALLQTEGKRRFSSTALVYRGVATHALLQTEGMRRFSSTALVYRGVATHTLLQMRSACAALVRQLLVYRGVATHTLLPMRSACAASSLTRHLIITLVPVSISQSKALRLHSKQTTVASAQRYANLRDYIVILPASISQSKAVRLHSKQITVASTRGYALSFGTVEK